MSKSDRRVWSECVEYDLLITVVQLRALHTLNFRRLTVPMLFMSIVDWIILDSFSYKWFALLIASSVTYRH